MGPPVGPVRTSHREKCSGIRRCQRHDLWQSSRTYQSGPVLAEARQWPHEAVDSEDGIFRCQSWCDLSAGQLDGAQGIPSTCRRPLGPDSPRRETARLSCSQQKMLSCPPAGRQDSSPSRRATGRCVRCGRRERLAPPRDCKSLTPEAQSDSMTAGRWRRRKRLRSDPHVPAPRPSGVAAFEQAGELPPSVNLASATPSSPMRRRRSSPRCSTSSQRLRIAEGYGGRRRAPAVG